MNSRKNSFKRVAASALAVLTVAAYTAPVANVGGLPSINALVADAAAGDTLVTFGTAAEYITNATDGTNSASATIISGAGQFKFTANTVLTISSKVPLQFNLSDDPDTLGVDESAILFEKAADGTDLLLKNGVAYVNANKYLETVTTNGYTYKVRVENGLQVNGVTTTVSVVNDGASKVTRTDGSEITIAQLTGDVTINGGEIAGVKNLVKKSTAKIVGTKAFEVYVKDNTNASAPLVKATANYDATKGIFVAEAPIPATTTNVEGANITIYINKITPNYTYKNNGTTLTASAANAPQVTAASITATYEQKVKKIKDVDGNAEALAAQPYKYEKAAEISTGATVPNESRVILTFKNDTTGEITSQKDDTDQSTFFNLKITKDGKELDDTTLIKYFANSTGVYPAAVSELTYDGVKTVANKHVPNPDVDNESIGTLAFTKTGVYKVEYTVYTKTVNATTGVVTYSPQTLVYNFTIATKPLLKATNVRLEAEGYNLNGAAKDQKSVINKVGIVDGVVQVEVNEFWTKNDIIEITPYIFEDPDDAAKFTVSPYDKEAEGENPAVVGKGMLAGGAKKGDPKSVIGTTRSSRLGTVNEITIVYNNNEYSAGDEAVNVKWKLVEAKKAVHFTQNEDYTNGGAAINSASTQDYYFQTTVDKLSTFRDDLFATMTVENAEIDDISFEYVSGYGTTANTEVLNYHKEGLPTEAGKYSVFFLYEDEIVATANILISEHALYAKPTSKQLSYTYGKKALTSDELAFVDVDGNKVTDAAVKDAEISYKKALKLTATQIKKITSDNTITFAAATKDANKEDILAGTYVVYTIGNDKYIEEKAVEGVDNSIDIANYVSEAHPFGVEVKGYLDAGTYIATIGTGEATTVGKKGYSLIEKKFAVQVAKKSIKTGMIVFDAVRYENGSTKTPGTYRIVDTAVSDDTAYNGGYDDLRLYASISGGVTSAKDIGEYTVTVQIDDDNCNYTGSASAKWHIVKAPVTESMKGLKFTDEKTTIYDNGQIHFEVTRPDDTQFANGVEKYGVIIDKTGKIAAPTKLANGKYPRKATEEGVVAKDFEDATNALQVGNGFKEGNQSDIQKKGKTPLVYGANIAITDVDTGAWFRPYVIDKKGQIFYGDVIYVNLVQEATDTLKLTMANSVSPLTRAANSGIDTTVVTKDEAKADQSATVLAKKTWREQVQSGFNNKTNTYYVYGSYTLEGNDLVKQSAVQSFGVVVDKKGTFAPVTGLASDGKTTVNEGLVIGKGFIEGKGGSNKMDEDEYGAVINPENNVTGVWVRCYVNLGKSTSSNKELVVYTDPVYITDISTYYGQTNIGAVTPDYVTVPGKYRFTFTAAVDQATHLAGATVKKTGIIVDVSGKYLKKDVNGDYVAAFEDLETEKKAYSSMLLGKGFLQGNMDGANYAGNVEPATYNHSGTNTKTDIPVVVRPYTIFTLNGVDITIYGNPTIRVKG